VIKKILAGLLISLSLMSPVKAEVFVDANVTTKTMDVYWDGDLLYTWRINPARDGYADAIGTFTPTRMHELWLSRKYNNAPMPFAIFYKGGYAIHAGNLNDAGSHGCIRLSRENAQTLYSLIEIDGMMNARVMVSE